jgi:hypothetical protein
MSYLPFTFIFHPQVVQRFPKWNYTAQKLLTLPPCGSDDRPPNIWETGWLGFAPGSLPSGKETLGETCCCEPADTTDVRGWAGTVNEFKKSMEKDGLSTGDFEIWMKGGPRGIVSCSEEAPWMGPGWGATSLGTLEYMLRKAPDRASLSTGAPLEPRGTWYLEGGLYTTDFDRGMESSTDGACL